MHGCIWALILIVAVLLAMPASPGFAQTSAPASEIDQLRQELRRMQERLQKLEQAPPAPAPVAAPASPLIPVAQVPPMAPRPGEREIQPDREPPTEVSLHRMNITGIAPLGNGLAISFGRFDTPYGYERHDAALNFTATTSELTRFGKPQSYTGFQVAYAFAPWLDVTGWIANQWENETTENGFQDNNSAKSFGGRVGVTPFQGDQWLNFGIGGWLGPERDEDTRHNRWIIDADVTWSPTPRLVFIGELVYGGEAKVSFRRRGIPYAGASVENRDVNWFALYALAHYDVTRWLGMTFRYGYFDDYQGWRTGVGQTLQSFTFTPAVHLSRLIPELRPLGVTYARTRMPLDWVDVRLEYRLDTSDKNVFSNAKPGIPVTSADKTAQQVTLQFVVNY